MPKLWTETIDAHRNAVREATLDAVAALVAEGGLTAVTMSAVAERAGIGRATLYKYFPDVNAVLTAWHERQIAAHLEQITAAVDAASPKDRLAAALTEYAVRQHHAHGHDSTDLGRMLHRGEHVDEAHRRLHAFVKALLSEAAEAGEVRDDIAASELATYCLHALAAAGALPGRAAVHRLVEVTLAGLKRT